MLPNGTVRVNVPEKLCTPSCWESMNKTVKEVNGLKGERDHALHGYSPGWKTLFPYGYDREAAMEAIIENPSALTGNYIEGFMGGIRSRIYFQGRSLNTLFPTFNQSPTP
jgi:hypothetical protein